MLRQLKLKSFIFLSLLFVLTACGTETEKETTGSQAVSEQSSVVDTAEKDAQIQAEMSFEIDGKEAADLGKSVEVSEGTSVLEAMKEHYEVEEKDGFITAINGHEQDEAEGKWWLYTVNDEQPTVGAAEYELKDGDQVKWTLNGN